MDTIVRAFATALAAARRAGTERLRNSLYGLELLRTGLADLVAELRANRLMGKLRS
jgi:hypothetical protein